MEAFTEVLRDSGLPVFLKQQVHFVPVKSEHRRTDFVLYFYGENVDVELHIEADGFSTHAATPTQFAGTCKRNRFYVEHGKWLIAFSGKEINSDPFRCAQEAIRILKIIHTKNQVIAYAMAETFKKEQEFPIHPVCALFLGYMRPFVNSALWSARDVPELVGFTQKLLTAHGNSIQQEINRRISNE